jgi:hypothetical protein
MRSVWGRALVQGLGFWPRCGRLGCQEPAWDLSVCLSVWDAGHPVWDLPLRASWHLAWLGLCTPRPVAHLRPPMPRRDAVKLPVHNFFGSMAVRRTTRRCCAWLAVAPTGLQLFGGSWGNT